MLPFIKPQICTTFRIDGLDMLEYKTLHVLPDNHLDQLQQVLCHLFTSFMNSFLCKRV